MLRVPLAFCRAQATSYFLLLTSYFLLPTSYFLLPTSYFLLPTSYFLLPTSYFLQVRPSLPWSEPSQLALAARAIADPHCIRKLGRGHALCSPSLSDCVVSILMPDWCMCSWTYSTWSAWSKFVSQPKAYFEMPSGITCKM